MSAAKHTPGPWKIGPWIKSQGVPVYLVVGAPSRKAVSGISVYGRDFRGIRRGEANVPEPEAEANARLIAAAPDLAAALAECERILYARHADANSPGGREAMAAVNAARSALNKAGVRS